MTVIIADRVRTFLTTERDYLRQHSKSAARPLTQRMRDAARIIHQFPQAGPPSPLPIAGLRRLVVDDYIFDYEIVGPDVHILSMRHGRQRDLYAPG